MLVIPVTIKQGRTEVRYDFRRNDNGQWAAWKDGAADGYILNLKAKTCTCDAGRHGRRCKHISKAEELEAYLSAPKAAAAPPAAEPPKTVVVAATPSAAPPTAAVAVANPDDRAKAVAEIIVKGNLALLTEEQKAQYLLAVCQACDLNPATRPFEFINMKGKLVLYALKSCSEQLRKRDRVSLAVVKTEDAGGVYVVTVQATTPDGRVDTDIGAVALGNLTGEERANAIMKAVTKAKRRTTLSICGLGMLDESEVESVAQADPVTGTPYPTLPPPVAVAPPQFAPPAPPPPPAAPNLAAPIDRVATLKRIDALQAELKIPANKMQEGLERAYGKPQLQALLDIELVDLAKRLEAKRPTAAFAA